MTEITIDAGGRDSAGRAFGALADEYSGHGGGWCRGESPLPYEEFAAGYHEVTAGLRAACEGLSSSLDQAGTGQVAMAAINRGTELANSRGWQV
ncbi:hypothetical protein E1292_07800 [Nonomuraea deserti]|uniref:Uncharacterized protein n=1 Tax=Nonomuraea deserti TaxID=1848322 RepID=A0A4R4VY67_9ACTN|nr:hypothetical protein [Nonomuraea deserti]TDD10401.1 hypothetical protein E1292_07800 [Nonomuraea deserti]